MNFAFKIYARVNMFWKSQLFKHIGNVMDETSQCMYTKGETKDKIVSVLPIKILQLLE